MHSANSVMFLVLIGLDIVATCGFLGGGGGGCCCSGGCGRKKRSIDFDESPSFSSDNNDLLCNSPELKQLIVKNMRSNARESSKSLQSALEDHDNHRYVVVCSENPFDYSVQRDSAYCGARNGSHYCQAFAI
ncbi:unnamed protein product [Caenorhabditis bovis]|uniref:Ground-like domain-containing protein n=1 Tax=Caenorhabditis bovis TaxID=2654633 RepID=A0A8S1ERV4_9PELO|nr:unnamed protein product [Caenorhabditis bovis]